MINKVEPRHWWQRPIASSLRRNRALRAMHKLVAEGRNPSSSSSNGHTLLLLLERLEEAGIPYVLEAHPGLGYMVTGKPELKPKAWVTEVELTREKLMQQVAKDKLAFAALSPAQQDHYTAVVAQLRNHARDSD
jgi:hypothetical protein